MLSRGAGPTVRIKLCRPPLFFGKLFFIIFFNSLFFVTWTIFYCCFNLYSFGFYLFFIVYLLIIFGCTSSSLLLSGFLWLQRANLLFAAMRGHLISAASLLQSTGSRFVGFSSFTRWALVAPSHAESPQARDWTCVSSSLHWQADSYPLRHQGSSPLFFKWHFKIEVFPHVLITFLKKEE